MGRRTERGAYGKPSTRQRQNWAYWCWGNNEKFRRVALGGFSSESEAYTQGYSAYPGEFDVHLLDTQSLVRAKQLLKAKDVEKGRKIDEAMRYASSDLP